jgi:hypothetical protein
MNPNKLFFLSLFFISLIYGLEIRGGNKGEYWLYIKKTSDSLNFQDNFADKLKLSLSSEKFLLKTNLFYWRRSLEAKEQLKYLDYAFSYEDGWLELLLGRYYATFGKGLCLNQYLDEDFKVDNSILGFKGVLKHPLGFLTVVLGEMRNIFFEEEEYLIKNDTTDQLRGIDYETQFILNKLKVNLGARYVRFHRKTDLVPRAFTELMGTNLEVNIGPYQGYLEYGYLLGSYPVIGGRLTGSGLLFTSTLTFSGLGLNFQFINYDSLGFGGHGFRYNELPSPVASGLSINRGTDEVGYNLSVNYAPLDNLLIELQTGRIYNSKKDQEILEGIGSLTLYLRENLELGLKFVRARKVRIELPAITKTELKPKLEINYNLEKYFWGFEYEHNFVSQDTSDYYEPKALISLGKPGRFEIGLSLTGRSRVPDWLMGKLGPERLFFNLEFSYDLSENHNLRIKIGEEIGGIVCSGGVCRFEEPFSGIKITLNSIF